MTYRQLALMEGLPSGSRSHEPGLTSAPLDPEGNGLLSAELGRACSLFFFPVILALSYRSWVFRLALFLQTVHKKGYTRAK